MQSVPHPPQRCVLVMGPSGVGKSTFAQQLAQRSEARFIEGDDYHPPENRAAMTAGIPLTDEMRRPWLIALASAVRTSCGNQHTVFACSALKRSYRDLLRSNIGELQLVYLTAPRDLIQQRMTARQHFMPAELLDSQIETLEVPADSEHPVTVDMSQSLEAAVGFTLAELTQRES